MEYGTTTAGQASSSSPIRMPAVALSAPPHPWRQMMTIAARPSSTAMAAPAKPVRNRLSATGVGNEKTRCRTMPSSTSWRLNSAARRDQVASGVGNARAISFRRSVPELKAIRALHPLLGRPKAFVTGTEGG